MKSKDLIKLIQQLDPEGESDILINDYDIDYIHPSKPMYWDNKAYVIESRGECRQPKKITLKTSGKKINISPIHPYEYFEQKIIQDQTFIDIETENSMFFWESPKIYFNKLFSCKYCKEYLKDADPDLYPYKKPLTQKISNYISNLTSNFYKEYLHYCDKLVEETLEEIEIIKNLISKIHSVNPQIIFNLPRKQLDNNTIHLTTTSIKGFFFSLKSNILTYEVRDIYDSSASSTNYVDININTFDFQKLLSEPWENLLYQKIENKFLKI